MRMRLTFLWSHLIHSVMVRTWRTAKKDRMVKTNVRRLKRTCSIWVNVKGRGEDRQLHRGRGHMFGRAWSQVTVDAVTGSDQTGKHYWQRFEDKFFKFMPWVASPVARSYRSLQGRWDAIKTSCSRWSGALEQVRNAPPSGATIDDYVSKLCFWLIVHCEMHCECVRCIF
jgi:hypothetical protein